MNIEELEIKKRQTLSEIKEKELGNYTSAELQVLEDQLLLIEDDINKFARISIECGVGKRFINANLLDFKNVFTDAYLFDNNSLSENITFGKKEDAEIVKKKVDFCGVLSKYSDDFIRHLSVGTSFIFVGPHGSGKTHAAHAVAFACAEKYLSVRKDLLDFYVIRMSDMMAMFSRRNEMGDQTVDKIRKKQLLIVDEVGSEKHSDSGWTIEQFVGRVLRYRYDNCLPTIITSNANAVDFMRAYGSRAETILLGNSFHTILLYTKKDMRKG